MSHGELQDELDALLARWKAGGVGWRDRAAALLEGFLRATERAGQAPSATATTLQRTARLLNRKAGR